MTHTPVPWIVNVWTTGRRTVEAPNGLVICEVHNTHNGNEANARFIVRACNAHEQLLEALTTLLNNVDHTRYNVRRDFNFFVADAMARAAIAQEKKP